MLIMHYIYLDKRKRSLFLSFFSQVLCLNVNFSQNYYFENHFNLKSCGFVIASVFLEYFCTFFGR